MTHLRDSCGNITSKTVMISAALWSIIQSASVSAASSPVSITVQGTVLDNTCTVESVQWVELLPVSLRDFGANGSTLGKQNISVELKDCGKDIARGVKITTSGFEDTADAGGYAFKNMDSTENGASGVGLLFYKSSESTKPFKVNDTEGETVFDLKPNSDNTLNFGAAYVATDVGNLSAGNFITTVYLRLEYQ